MKKILTLIFLSLCPLSFAQIDKKIVVSQDSFKNEEQAIELINGWKYHAGDNPAWADPTFDDNGWETVHTWVNPNKLLGDGWEGIGWFRLHLAVSASLWNKPLALHLYQRGASEIYLDGVQIDKVGQVRGEEADAYIVKKISFQEKVDHLIAVRYSNLSVNVHDKSGLNIGFRMAVFRDANHTFEHQISHLKRVTSEKILFSAVPLAFALLHLLLFVFYPRARENLHYAIFISFWAAAAFMDYKKNENLAQLEIIHHLFLILVCVSGVRFIYSLFYPKLPKRFFLFVAGGIGVGVWNLYNHYALNLFALIVIAEMLQVIVVAILKRKEAAWITGMGPLILVTVGIYEMAMNLYNFQPIGGIYNPTCTKSGIAGFGVSGIIKDNVSVITAFRGASVLQHLYSLSIQCVVVPGRIMDEMVHRWVIG